MSQVMSERGDAQGTYVVQCVGPLDPKDGERIASYVKEHPELSRPRLDCFACGGQGGFVDDDTGDRTECDCCKGSGNVGGFGSSCNLEAARILGIPLTEKWQDVADNTVATVGKNLALDTYLAGSAYTVTGPYMGLISSVSYSAIAAADTMASHAGWTEAGSTNAPTYTRPRPTAAWSAASAGSKAFSAALSFAITSTGTVKGAFLVYGSAATTMIDGTVGTLYSAGLFATGDRAVLSGDTLNVSYTASI